MRITRDDRAEATIISQLLIIGITAGIVFVAATYAYFAVDTAISEADETAAQLSLRGSMNRLESLVQQGVGASTVIALPHQGDSVFAGFSPKGNSQDRLVITAASNGITFESLADGDGDFNVCGADGLTMSITWNWNAFEWSEDTENRAPECTGLQASHDLNGIVTIQIHEGPDLRAVAVIADLHLMTIDTGGDELPAWLGNIILGGSQQVTSQLHIQNNGALAIRLWALNGPSFASQSDEQLMHVEVTDQSWLAQASDMNDVQILAAGPHREAILGLYQQHGGTRDGNAVSFDVSRVDVHGTAMHGEPHR